MIVKIKLHKRPTFRKLLDYILKDKDRLFDRAEKSFVITQNLKGRSIESWEKQLKENEMNRLRKRINSVYLSHEILSWHREDAKNISLEKMELMAREYIQLRNPKGMFVAAPHFDRQHFHIHLLVSGIEYKSGKGMRLSKIALAKLKKDIQQYQQEKFPELSKSIVAHGKKEIHIPKTTEKEYQLKYRIGRETEKDAVIAKLKSCYKEANSKETLVELLKESGLQPYKRGEKITGVIYGKYKFRFRRLGFSEEQLEQLDKRKEKQNELQQSRNKRTEKRIER